MKTTIRTFFIFLTFVSVSAAENYERNTAKWKEIVRPPESNPVERTVWFYRANYSLLKWTVRDENDVVIAYLDEDSLPNHPRPDFECKVEIFQDGSAFYKTDNGWFVGFNRGEWGGALYWFSEDGQKNIKISDHQIVDFIPHEGHILAIEGVAHLGGSKGSVIEIDTKEDGLSFTVSTIVKLPEAPEAAVFMRNGELVLALSDSLVIWSKTSGLKILAKDVWRGLYPNSIAISNDEKKVYIGMRQYVAEYNFSNETLRYLIPNEEFQNYLPEEDEIGIRKQYKSIYQHENECK